MNCTVIVASNAWEGLAIVGYLLPNSFHSTSPAATHD